MKTQADSITLEREKTSFKDALLDQRILLVIVIIGLVIVTGAINPKFFATNNIISIFQSIAVGGLLTMGMAMLLLSGGLDLAIGNIMILSGCIMSILITGGTMQTASSMDEVLSVAGSDIPGYTSVPVAILIAMGVSIGCGALNGLIVAKTKCTPLIITLGMSSAYFGIALLLSGGKYLAFRLAFEPLRVARVGEVIPVTLFIFIAMVVFTWFLVNRTKYGRRIVSIGGNEENARLSGIKVDKYKIITYAISGGFCGIASILYASRLDSVTAGGGSGYELTALTAAIIGGVTFAGGKGTISGAFLGMLFMGVLANAMNILGVSSYVQIMVQGLIVVAAVSISNIDNIRKRYG